MANRLKVLAEKCSGCRICQLMCSLIQHGSAFNPRKGLIRVKINRTPQINTPISEIDIPNVCLQCEPAPCAESCAVEAFEWGNRLKTWSINRELCTGCGICVEDCKYNMILIDNDKAMKCDLCGGDPVCVQFCPTGALIFD